MSGDRLGGLQGEQRRRREAPQRPSDRTGPEVTLQPEQAGSTEVAERGRCLVPELPTTWTRDVLYLSWAISEPDAAWEITLSKVRGQGGLSSREDGPGKSPRAWLDKKPELYNRKRHYGTDPLSRASVELSWIFLSKNTKQTKGHNASLLSLRSSPRNPNGDLCRSSTRPPLSEHSLAAR